MHLDGRVRSASGAEDRWVDQCIGGDRIAAREQVARAYGEQPRIARSRADEIYTIPREPAFATLT
jgi:hypothetical protein